MPRPPEPIEAVFDSSEAAAYVTFDQDLAAPAGGSWSNLTFRLHQPTRWYETGAVTQPAGNVIRVAGVSAHVMAGSAAIDYDDSLQTLIGVNGLPVASFTGFPCPTIP